jgi:hypothetical protein
VTEKTRHEKGGIRRAKEEGKTSKREEKGNKQKKRRTNFLKK